MTSCTMDANGWNGVAVHDKDSHATVTKCHINDNEMNGVFAQDGGVCDVVDCEMVGNKMMNIEE